MARICFVGGGLDGGGMERALTSMANYFSNNGHSVSIINLFKTDIFFKINSNIGVSWPSIDRSENNRILYAIKLLPFVRKSIKSFQADVVFSYGEWYNSFVLLSTVNMKIPIYVLDRMGPNINLGFLLENARKYLYPLANGVIVQTQTAAQLLAPKLIKNIEIFVIPNPVNTIDGDKTAKKKQIVSCGRLSKEKGHSILLKAFAQIPHFEWTLHLIGDGPERVNLEKEASSLGISNRVFFHGHLKKFNHLMIESQIFVLPSYYEGFPNALLEAMSVPMACISSNCIAGPSDIIENETNGILVEPDNITALANQMNRLIVDDVLREFIASNAINVRERYSFEQISKLVERLIP